MERPGEYHHQHLVHSHAHEGDIPGTVNLQAREGDDTAYGQALFPVPNEDPNDPLQWPAYKKTMILIIVSLYSFLGNSSLLGPSAYIAVYAKEFNITPTVASQLVSYPNLAFGFGSLILVPLYLKIGRRPVMLFSIILFMAGLIGASQATTFGGLMAARVIHGLGSGVCEALPVQLVNDIFFLHERGKKIGYYTVCLCLGSIGPVPAGYMLGAGYSWRLFFYVEFAFAGALFILAFIFVEESAYKRDKMAFGQQSPVPSLSEGSKEGRILQSERLDHVPTEHYIPPRKSFISTLKPWSGIDPEADFFMTMIRPFSYFFVPAVFWVVTTYGIYIGLGALAFNFTFPLLITAPPYNWSPLSSGLIAMGNVVGFLLAVPFTFTSDRLAAYLTRKNNGIREAEMRLGVLLVPLLISPAGLIVYGLACQNQLNWFSYFAGVAMVNWAAYFFFSFTLAYAVDSYNANTSEMLIAMNLGKQAISFGMGFKLLDWILTDGYAVVIAGIFGAVLLCNNLAVFIFMIWGKKIRIFTAKSKLGAWHKKTGRGQAMTH